MVYVDSELSDFGVEVISEIDLLSIDELLGIDELFLVIEVVYNLLNNFLVVMVVLIDKMVVFMDVNVIFLLQVMQGMVINFGGMIQGWQVFIFKLEGFKVLVKGDYVNILDENDIIKYIQQGDFIELRRDIYFNEVVLFIVIKLLMVIIDMGVKQFGIVYFILDSIKIVFDGDDWFFNGVG